MESSVQRDIWRDAYSLIETMTENQQIEGMSQEALEGYEAGVLQMATKVVLLYRSRLSIAAKQAHREPVAYAEEEL